MVRLRLLDVERRKEKERDFSNKHVIGQEIRLSTKPLKRCSLSPTGMIPTDVTLAAVDPAVVEALGSNPTVVSSLLPFL